MKFSLKQLYLRSRRFSAFLLGFVFVISGILKLMDPVGTGLIVDEYYAFFKVGFLDFSSKAMGIFMAFVETVTGVCLVTGVWRKVTAAVTLALMSLFTLVTAVLVIFNPPMDCGCFGEAVHLTHIQTFIKNIVLDVMAVYAFVPFRDFGKAKKRKYVSFALVIIAVIVFSLYSLLNIPAVDFTDYSLSERIQTGNKTVYDTEQLYEAVFTYERNGEQRTFTLDNLPDSTWTFISSETVAKGNPADYREEPRLSFYDASGNYMDELAYEGNVMVISIYNPEKFGEDDFLKVSSLVQASVQNGIRPLILSASSHSDFGKAMAEAGLNENIAASLLSGMYTSDYKTLITLNRSNGGATYLCEGFILKKWAQRNLPDKDSLHQLLSLDQTEVYLNSSTYANLKFQAFMLYIMAVMLLL